MYKLSSTTVLTVPSLAKLRFATTLTRTARRALGPPKSNVSVVWMRGRLERPSSVLRTCYPGTATVLPTLLSIVTLHPPTLRMSAKTDIRPPQGGWGQSREAGAPQAFKAASGAVSQVQRAPVLPVRPVGAKGLALTLSAESAYFLRVA